MHQHDVHQHIRTVQCWGVILNMGLGCDLELGDWFVDHKISASYDVGALSPRKGM